MGCECFLPAFFIVKIAPLKSTKQSHKELARLTSEKKSFTILIFCTRFCKWLIYNSVDNFRFTHSLINTKWTHEAEKHVMMIIMLNLNTQVWDNRYVGGRSFIGMMNQHSRNRRLLMFTFTFSMKTNWKGKRSDDNKTYFIPFMGSRVVIV